MPDYWGLMIFVETNSYAINLGGFAGKRRGSAGRCSTRFKAVEFSADGMTSSLSETATKDYWSASLAASSFLVPGFLKVLYERLPAGMMQTLLPDVFCGSLSFRVPITAEKSPLLQFGGSRRAAPSNVRSRASRFKSGSKFGKLAFISSPSLLIKFKELLPRSECSLSLGKSAQKHWTYFW